MFPRTMIHRQLGLERLLLMLGTILLVRITVSGWPSARRSPSGS